MSDGLPEFRDYFTVFPDTGITELYCNRCQRAWQTGHHPSLDVLIEQAQAHDLAEHPESNHD
jgi:hypothetical protein